MKILQITRAFPPAVGGVESQVKEIALRLTRKGHEVTICTSDLLKEVPLRRLPNGWSDRGVPFEICRHKAVPIPWRKNEGTYFAPTVFFSHARGDLPSIAHCQGLNLFTVSASLFIQRARKCKIVCSTHLDPIILYNKFLRTILEQFDGLVALTEEELRRMSTLGIDRSKIRLIPNGVDLQSFAHLPAREKFRTSTGIMGNLILYAGRIDVRKGCDVLIEAVSIAQRRVGKCTLVFAGPDCGSEGYLRNLSRRRGVRAIFSGNLTPACLRSALVACDVFALPSLSEGFGLTILEAMLCGAPVVATRVGGIPTLVRDEETGLLVSPSDHQSLADAICRLVKDKQLSARLADKAKLLASKYSISRTVEELEKFYHYLLSG
jgi:glycosyltransferase involved in cell wall biosynthesis